MKLIVLPQSSDESPAARDKRLALTLAFEMAFAVSDTKDITPEQWAEMGYPQWGTA